MKIGIVNTGGDVQSLNAIIYAAAKYGISKGHEMIGFKYGWEGILDKNFTELNQAKIRGIAHIGGTILKTTNKGRFAGKAGGEGGISKISEEMLNLAKNNLAELGIDALIEIGGDAGISSADQLAEIGVKIVGLPKSIDNDLENVNRTFGFSTAVEVVTESLDRIHTTATSHDRVLFVEVMGRHAGWIPLYSGLAGGANMILLPEIKFEYTKILEFLRNRKEKGMTSSIVVVSEGASAKDEEVISKSIGKPEAQLGGISNHIINRLSLLAPDEFEMRNTVLGHIQRGGAANAEDKILAKIYGVASIDAAEKGEFGKMVSIDGDKVSYIPFAEAVKELKVVTKDSLMYQSAKKIGISFGE